MGENCLASLEATRRLGFSFGCLHQLFVEKLSGMYMKSICYALKEFEKELHLFEVDVLTLEQTSVYSTNISACKKFKYWDNTNPAYLEKLDSIESARAGYKEAEKTGLAICAICVEHLNDGFRQKLSRTPARLIDTLFKKVSK